MSSANIRTVLIAPQRLAGWLQRFAASHGAVTIIAGVEFLDLRAADGTTAHCQVPFPPLRFDPQDPWGALIGHAERDRKFGVLLIRRGGYAAGVFEAGRLTASKVGSRYVQGRTAAGGTSQQRFARRRDNQAAELVGSAVEVALRIIAPEAGTLAALVTGGDRPMIASALADRRLARLANLPQAPFLTVADPRQKVLLQAGVSACAIRVTVTDG